MSNNHIRRIQFSGCYDTLYNPPPLNMSLMSLFLTNNKELNNKPCINCVDYAKGSLSDRACSECREPEYNKFLEKYE